MAETIERKYGDGCKGCFFRRQISAGSKITACFYAIEMDKLRGCPAGDGCAHYKSKSYTFKSKKKNCSNCGAPLKEQAVCEYCGTEG